MTLDPAAEAERLRALRDLAVLDTDAEQDFDDLAFIAARVAGAPLALVSLVDEHRQWFKARIGVAVAETPRDLGFCTHTIAASGVFVVHDSTTDPRFAHHPMVLGPPFVRSYAGAPLETRDGHRIGTLCVLDQRPRRFSAAQVAGLEALARQVMRQLELRQLSRALRSANDELTAASARLHAVSSQLDAFFTTSLELLGLGGIDGYFRLLNPAWTQTLGWPLDQLYARPWFDLVHPEDAPSARAMWRRGVPSSAGVRVTNRCRHRDGTYRWLAWSINLAGTTVVTAARDVTLERGLRESLRATVQLQRAILDATRYAIIQAGPDGVIHTFNRGAEALLGYRARDVVGVATASSLRLPDERDASPFDVSAARRDPVGEYEATMVHRDGRRIPVLMSSSPLFDDVGTASGHVEVAADITERRNAERLLRDHVEMMERLSFVDELTGLPNRRGFLAAGAAVLAKCAAAGRSAVMLYIDLDKFKEVNDEHGHAAGDVLLQRVARLLRAQARAEDVVGRLGGDEFVMLLTDCPDPEWVVGRLRARAAEEEDPRGPVFQFSVGFAFCNPREGRSIEDLLRRSDEAMYVDKQSRSVPK